MISTHWLEKRQIHWNRLETLLNQSKNQGLNSLTRTELQELGLLYRQAAADLSTLREDRSGRSYERFLNLLLSRAHNTIYSGQKSSPWNILHFYRFTYPKIFRRNLSLFNAAVLLFMAGALAGMMLAATNREFMQSFLGPSMVDSIDHHKMWTDSVVSIKPAASSAIMTNNLSVAFFAFASGITAGLGTVYILVFNGVMVGVIGMACWYGGMSLSLWRPATCRPKNLVAWFPRRWDEARCFQLWNTISASSWRTRMKKWTRLPRIRGRRNYSPCREARPCCGFARSFIPPKVKPLSTCWAFTALIDTRC